jgi:hypothetical protein
MLMASTNAETELRVLGEELRRQSAEVLARTVERNSGAGVLLSHAVEERFERIGEVSTDAVARWIAGASAGEAMEVGQEVWQIFGGFAAQRAAPLAEVTKRIWRWRDEVRDTLEATGVRLALSDAALTQAQAMLETTLRRRS